MNWVVAATPILLVLGGGTLIAVLMIARRARANIVRRVELVAAAPEPQVPEKPDNLLKKDVLNPFNERLRRTFALGAGRSWGMKAGGLTLLAATIPTGAGAWTLAHSVLGLPLWFAGSAALFVAVLAPRMILLRQQKKSDSQFNDLFPGAVDSIARMLRAGLPVATAVHSIGAEAPAPVNMVFTKVADQIDIGTPLEEALEATSQQVALADFRFFAVAVALQHATGGNLAATLEIISDIIRRRRAIRLKAKAATSEIRVTAYVVGALPFLIVGALLLIQPGYLNPLYADPRGQVILCIAAGLLLLAGLSMRQMMRSVTN